MNDEHERDRQALPYIVMINEVGQAVNGKSHWGPWFTYDELEEMHEAISLAMEFHEAGKVTPTMVGRLTHWQQNRLQDEPPGWSKAAFVDAVFGRVGFVYLMEDTSTGYWKIGFSKRPEFRERTLQSQKPTIELRAQWPGRISDERRVQRMFEEQRIRGEWFKLSKADRGLIASMLADVGETIKNSGVLENYEHKSDKLGDRGETAGRRD